jgi:pantoate--beta-alanine ligase
MKTLRTIAETRQALQAPRRAGFRLGLVPTMGAFHDGHLSLMTRAREDCDVVVVSLFVNPAQFNDRADLSAYPRDEARDAAQAAEQGVDYLFAPAASEIYPADFSTTVSVAGVTETLEGAARGRGHFDGVTTIVTKLFNIVGPDVAYFGQKDAQQAIVIKRLVRDLDLPLRIEVCATLREPDGLARSSRNVHLSSAERARATAIPRALSAARTAVSEGERDPAAVATRARQELTSEGIEPEYLELVAADTLTPVDAIEGDVIAVIAARIGNTRLIDNEIITRALGVSPRARINGRPNK